ncbi:7529_t:CDS:2 [Racocetra fulgida]|uniref:7529_t:CDS:1 n=1 Tax=Racocetra fulgida TaxID=60492 RepID=A0A9N8Z7E0_9GLOM|nr:7529_t:CDS:2 [Racocetra fulgida]
MTKQKYSTLNKKINHEQMQSPHSWEEVYQCIKDYRKTTVAPVDTMGCERLAEKPNDVITPQSLIALMLSSQTKDQVTAAAMQNLRQQLTGGLNIESIMQVDEEFLDQCISKQAAKICKEEYGGDIPNSVEELMKLPGVGPKMAGPEATQNLYIKTQKRK